MVCLFPLLTTSAARFLPKGGITPHTWQITLQCISTRRATPNPAPSAPCLCHIRRFSISDRRLDLVCADQVELSKPDFSDQKITHTRNLCAPDDAWNLCVTVTSSAGLAMGSYDTTSAKPAETFTLGNVDTRENMVLQLWKALTLQCGITMPGSSLRNSWTFTLFLVRRLSTARCFMGKLVSVSVKPRLG